MKKAFLFLFTVITFSAISQTDYTRVWGSYHIKNLLVLDSKIDNQGNLIVLGVYLNSDGVYQPASFFNSLATAGAYQNNCYWAKKRCHAVSKYSPNGVLLWSTLLNSNSDNDQYSKIAIDNYNNIYVGGYITGNDNAIGIVNAPANFTNNSAFKGVVCKLNANGSYDFGRFMPFIIDDIVFDGNNKLYLTGTTTKQTEVTTVGVFQPNFIIYANQVANGVVACYDDNLNKVWATYNGKGNEYNELYSKTITLDNSQNVYIGGVTNNSNNCYYNTNSFQGQGNDYGITISSYICKFNNQGQRIWSTYFGTAINDGYTIISNMTINDGFLYFIGNTRVSTSIATAGSFQNIKAGNPANASNSADGFIAKFDLNGNRIWGTYFGGIQDDFIRKIAIKNNTIYIAGFSISTVLATTTSNQAPYNIPPNSGKFSTFVAQLNLEGSQKNWCTYFGGENDTYCTNLIFGSNSEFYVFGDTDSTTNISTPNANQSNFCNIFNTNNGNVLRNGFLARFDPTTPLSITVSYNQYSSSFEIFPNPNNGNFLIKIAASNDHDKISIIDSQGRAVFVKNTIGLNENINLENQLQSGVYFVQ
ncbi:MAG: T9SS type A sorting domain-containing protein, partial [Flavobacterium sp.]|nr:T9SS type A sorting domain-containing protein [Flavobacterium sp.]